MVDAEKVTDYIETVKGRSKTSNLDPKMYEKLKKATKDVAVETVEFDIQKRPPKRPFNKKFYPIVD